MSATGRGTERNPNDFYETPEEATFALLHDCPWLFERLYFPHNRPILEPAVGHGAIARAFKKYLQWRAPRLDLPKWVGIDIENEATNVEQYIKGDFLNWEPKTKNEFGLIITNPPFTLAQAFIDHCFDIAPKTILIMLLRLNFYGSEKRAYWWQDKIPDQTLILSERPFPDMTEYAWFIWGGPSMGRQPVMVLPPFPYTEQVNGQLSLLPPRYMPEIGRSRK